MTFPVKTHSPQPFVIVPERTQLTAEAPDGGPPIVFETERALIALKAPLAAVLAYDGYAYTSVTNENDEATQGFQPFGPAANDDSALLLGFDYDRRFPGARTQSGDLDAAGQSRSRHRSNAVCPMRPHSLRRRFAGNSGTAANGSRLSLLKDETRAFTRSGHVYLQTPAKGMQQTVIPPEPKPLYWIRGRVERSQYERPPKLLAIRTNTVAVRQAETVAV